MSYIQPSISTVDDKRSFACFPAAVLVLIINRQEKFLMLRHPQRNKWEVVNGALEAGETVLNGSLREIKEEAGSKLRVKPMGLIHLENFHYDENVRYMFSISYLMMLLGGEVLPGDDMKGSMPQWFSIEELKDISDQILVPVNGFWQFERALELFRIWKDQPIPPLQPDLLWPPQNKYQM